MTVKEEDKKTPKQEQTATSGQSVTGAGAPRKQKRERNRMRSSCWTRSSSSSCRASLTQAVVLDVHWTVACLQPLVKQVMCRNPSGREELQVKPNEPLRRTDLMSPHLELHREPHHRNRTLQCLRKHNSRTDHKQSPQQQPNPKSPPKLLPKINPQSTRQRRRRSKWSRRWRSRSTLR